jgi:predicted dehydrogenase
MAQRVVRFGVIGAGLMGREFASAAARWSHLLQQDARPEIVSVCDPHLPATEWFRDSVPGIQVTAHYRELLANPDVEAVYCAVPHNLHQEIYIAAIVAGKHLLAEKPFGIDLPAALRIDDVARRHPEILVRCSGQFPFFPGVQRIVQMAEEGEFGKIIEVRAGFLHSSDLDPTKPINWKRKIETNGEYGCLGDLGLHVVHVPARLGWVPKNVRALLSKVVDERPDGKGGMAACETWDNAILACETAEFPILYETKRIAPGEANTWYLNVYGTQNSAEFSTKYPKTLRTMPYKPGDRQAWQAEDLGYASAYPVITGHIFEFGFTDAILQMWAAFLDELVHRDKMHGSFGCATPSEALLSHRLFTAALESQKTGGTILVR